MQRNKFQNRILKVCIDKQKNDSSVNETRDKNREHDRSNLLGSVILPNIVNQSHIDCSYDHIDHSDEDTDCSG